MRNGRTLGQSGRFTQLAPVRPNFDVAAMARLSVGPSWASLIDAQRQQMTELGRHISAICADRFDSYAGQKLEVTGQQPSASGVMVKSQITKAKLRPFNLKWIGKIAVPQGARLGLEPRVDVIHNYRLT